MLRDPTEIKIARLKFGLTQTQLARNAGVSQSLIAKLEGGKIDASYSHVKKIFDCLEARESEGHSVLTARDVMNRKIFLVSANDSANKVIGLMRRHGFSQLPVFEHNHPIGSISEKSIIDRISEGFDSRKLQTLKCRELMEESFPIVSESTPLPAVSELLKHHFAVLVRRGEKIVGIITKADLLKAIES